MPGRTLSNQDTLLRQWQMLRLIPRYPYKITSRVIKDKLASEDFMVTKRTVERDLQALSAAFPIVVDDREKPFGWSWAKDASAFDLPGLSNTEALTFQLVERHLKPLLPCSLLKQLQPYFKTAKQKLSALPQQSRGHSWADKVRVVQPTQALLPPTIDSGIQHAVYDALLHNRQVKVTYQKRGEKVPVEYTLHLLGIVQRGAVTYVVCTVFRYQDIRLLALHRFHSAEMLDDISKRPKGFSLDDYIASGALGFDNGTTINLQVIFTKDAAAHLYETPLSKDQVLTVIDDAHTKLTATVINNSQLIWWLLGFGEWVEILKPKALRDSFSATAQALSKIYRK